MEDLTQHQLILLTLLISFVTSIGTGIITVSLLQEAPPVITSTVNRVVEKTIETVVQSPIVGSKNTETVREVTVVVNQEDLVTESIEKNAKSLVRIYETRALGGVERFYGVGIIVPSGIVSAAASTYDANANYRIQFSDGESTLVTREAGAPGSQVVLFKITDGTTRTAATFGDIHTLKLGQTLITIGGETQNVVSIGTLSAVLTAAENTSPTRLDLNIEEKDRVAGAPVVTLQGNVIGLRIVESLADGTTRVRYIPANIVQSIALKTAI